MAKRKGAIWIDSSAVQGKGAFVQIRPLKYGEAKSIQQTGGTLTDAEQVAQGERLLIDHIVGWNWVDEDGMSLPLPKDQPGVLDDLTSEEMEFLSKALSGDPNAVSD